MVLTPSGMLMRGLSNIGRRYLAELRDEPWISVSGDCSGPEGDRLIGAYSPVDSDVERKILYGIVYKKSEGL